MSDEAQSRKPGCADTDSADVIPADELSMVSPDLPLPEFRDSARGNVSSRLGLDNARENEADVFCSRGTFSPSSPLPGTC